MPSQPWRLYQGEPLMKHHKNIYDEYDDDNDYNNYYNDDGDYKWQTHNMQHDRRISPLYLSLFPQNMASAIFLSLQWDI